MIWPVLVMCALLAGIFFMRMNERANRDRREPDAGSAILDFGRAFPGEAIRAIHATVDQKAYFVRLHDGKAGFMASHGAHFVCHLIQPGKVYVADAPSSRGLMVRFSDYGQFDGVYEFETPEMAAEVSLWLLGSFSLNSDLKTLSAR